MPAAKRHHAGGLELSRLTLASLAVWLAVTCLVAIDRMPVATATAGPSENIPVAAESQVAAMVEPASFELADVGDEIAASQSAPADLKTAALAAVAAVPTGPSRFVFQEDVGGQLLSARLTPPARFEVWPVPFVSEPKPWRTLNLDPLPRDTLSLTRAIIRQEPRVASIAPREDLSVRPLDLPGLPSEVALSVPAPLQIVPLPRSFIPSADPQQVPFLEISTMPPKEKVDPAANPVRAKAESALFQARLLAASLPTAFVRLAIPDPYEQIRAVRLTSKLPDSDPTLFPAGQPLRPHFPVIDVPGETK